jgi:cob(I)alamin adenosyltransferase
MSSSIYTRSGDAGDTSLADGSRLPKNAARVEAYGAIDEANAWVSAARAQTKEPLLGKTLEFLQHRLYNCSSNLATPPAASGFSPPQVYQGDVEFLERAIDRFEETTGPVSVFVLPGGTQAAAMLHVARTVCRRAERRIVALIKTDEPVDTLVLKLVNRASDFLFAAARYANRVSGDVAWNKDLPPPEL